MSNNKPEFVGDMIELPTPIELTDSQKLDYLYRVAKRADALMNELEPQIKPFLDGLAKNPMLKMLGLGK